MRVIVCGGRNYRGVDEDAHVFDTLDAIHDKTPITAIIEGGASGADATARFWAREVSEVKCITIPADWDTHGKAAGPIRNQRMIDDFHPDLVVAFPGGKGTADMVRRAQAAGLRIVDERTPSDGDPKHG